MAADSQASAKPQGAAFDPAGRFVRITGRRPNGFVEFDFAIGEPEVFVELILSREAFEAFCTDNHVEMLAAGEDKDATDDWNWRLADATHTRFR